MDKNPANSNGFFIHSMSMKDSEREIFGRDLPPRTVGLTFDDGPHKA